MSWIEFGSYLRQTSTLGAGAVSVSSMWSAVPSCASSFVRAVGADILGTLSVGNLIGGATNVVLSYSSTKPAEKTALKEEGTQRLAKGAIGIVVSSFCSSASLSAFKFLGGAGGGLFFVAEMCDPHVIGVSAKTSLVAKIALRAVGATLIAAGAGIPTLSLGGAVAAVGLVGAGMVYSQSNIKNCMAQLI